MVEKILNNRILVLYVLPFFLGLLSVFSFQPFNFSFINFLLFLIFFSLVFYVKKKSQSTYRKKPFRKNLFLLGFIFGFGFYLGGVFWITYSLTFEDSFKFLIPFALILIPLFLGLFNGLTTLVIGKFLDYNFSSILLFAGSFSLSDYIRGKVLSGFPWNVWGYSWSWFGEIIQILNPIGLFAFNLISISIFTIPVVLFYKSSMKEKILTLAFTFLFIFLIYIYGSFQINKNKNLLDNFNNDKIYTKIISPNFELKYNSSISEIEEKLKKLIRYSDPDKNQKTLFIWPEGVFSGYSFDEVSAFKQGETEREFLTLEELQAAVEVDCDMPKLKTAFIFSCLTGLRWSDIKKLTWSEIQQSKDLGHYIRFTQQKTKGVETQPVSEQAIDLLGERQEPAERVFKDLKYSSWHNLKLQQWMMRAGITKSISFHCARHTYATLQITAGTDIYTVSKLLGHRELKTTQIYAKIIDNKKREAANKIQIKL